jgi:hypothetical protein
MGGEVMSHPPPPGVYSLRDAPYKTNRGHENDFAAPWLKAWNTKPVICDAVKRIIGLFGEDRCFCPGPPGAVRRP